MPAKGNPRPAEIWNNAPPRDASWAMIAIPRFLILLALGASLAAAAEGPWLTDFEEAGKQAAKEDKAILMDFTGSDWCGWCIKLDKEVFSKKEFLDFASKHLVLLEVDFPRKKKLPEEGQEKLLLRATGGLSFFNTSKLDLSKLSTTGIKDDLDSYVQGFSKDAREIFEHFNFADFVGIH